MEATGDDERANGAEAASAAAETARGGQRHDGADGDATAAPDRQAARDYINSEPYDYMSESEYDDEYESDYGALQSVGCWVRLRACWERTVWSIRWSLRTQGRKSRSGRLLERDNAFDQCSGRLHVGQQASRKTQGEILALYGDDWFHVVLSWSTWQLVLVMMVLYTTLLLVFGALYVAVDRPGQACGLAASAAEGVPYQTAFAFSLITSSTIGYGFPASGDPFFHDCPELVIVVYFQVIMSLLVNALIVGMVLQRLGRADSRAAQVVFSNKACIRCIHGRFYFMFQVYDLDQRHPVVEAHVRCYAVFHETDGTNTVHFQTRYMRLQNPNDELGGVLFLSVPCTVVHCIDQWSPLMASFEQRLNWENTNDDFVHNSANRYVFPSLVLREADAECGNRDGTSCPICGESFPTDQHLLRHVRYMQWEEKLNGAGPALRENAQRFQRGESYLNIGETSDERYVPEGARAALDDLHKRFGPDVLDDINSGTSRSASDYYSHQKEDEGPRRSKSAKDRTPSRRSHGTRNETESVKGIRAGLPTKVHRLLRYYADLSMPLTHQDVDMNLLPTGPTVVPEKDERKRRNTTDVFSLFEDAPRPAEAGPGPPPSSANSLLSGNDPVGPANSPGRGAQPGDDANSKGREEPEQPSARRKFKPRVRPVDEFRRAIEDHVESSGIEIIVLVEGIEARSSNSFQARHSYTAEDIEFDKFFAPCMAVSANGHAQVNLNSFHQMVPVPSYVSEAIVQSHT